MPGLLTLRSSSSSSSSASSRSTACKKPPLQPRHLHLSDFDAAVPPNLSITRALPAFHSSASNMQLPPPHAPQPIDCGPKLVTDPLSQRTRLNCGSPTLNYSSSGSPHDPSTVCLAAMVHEFLEEDVTSVGSCGRSRCNCVDGVCGDNEDACMAEEPKEPKLPDLQLCEILEGITNCTSKPELLLLVDVARAVEAETDELMGAAGQNAYFQSDVINMDLLRRPVMKRLRQEGYNAAICKSRWKHSDGLPAGDYEYIDVVIEGGNGTAEAPKKVDRFLVDIDFRPQFEIARASPRYMTLLDVLPRLFVGRAERLKQIVKVMSAAAKRSLKEEGLLLPPWRKHRYMQAKWLSSYRRTTNGIAAAAASSVSMSASLTTTAAKYGRPEEFQLGLGFQAPKMLSVELNKGMDVLSFKETAAMAEAYATRLAAAHKQQDVHMKARVDALLVKEDGDGAAFCTGARFTDWQLPALDVKPPKGACNHVRVSGLSTALKVRH